jgi:hypothetical protein
MGALTGFDLRRLAADKAALLLIYFIKLYNIILIIVYFYIVSAVND